MQYWAERFVGEGHCQVLATDAHHPQRRPPLLAEAREAAAVLVGRQAAEHMVVTRPAGVIADADCWDCWWPGLEKFSLTARPPTRQCSPS